MTSHISAGSATSGPATGSVAMSRLAGMLLRHRWVVVGFWVVILVAGAGLTKTVSHRMSNDLALPGEPAYQANQQITAIYNGGIQAPLVPAVTLPAGHTAYTDMAQLGRAFEAAGRALQVPVAWYGNAGSRFLGNGGRTAFGLVLPPGTQWVDAPDLSSEVAAAMRPDLPHGAVLNVTGLAPLSSYGRSGRSSASILSITLAGGVLALLVLAFVFGSLLALTPLLVALVAIFTTFLPLGVLTTFASVSSFEKYLVGLLGLGLAIDYSLLVVTRWREEVHRGRPGDDAVRVAVATAGRAVVLSGLTVTAGLLSLVLLPVPFVRSFGYSSMFIPLISSLVAVTLLPVVLAIGGRRLDWPHRRSDASASRGWTAWTRGVVRWRWVAVAAGAAVLAALGAFAWGMQTGNPAASSLAKSGPAYQGLATLRSAGVPAGVLSPIEVLLPRGTDRAAAQHRLSAASGVWDAVAPSGPGWHRRGTALAIVVPAAEPATATGRATVTGVRQVASRDLPGSLVGGTAAQNADFGSAVFGRFPLMLGLVSLVAFVVLMRAFRSVILAVKAVVLGLASIAASLGAVVLIWQRGYGSSAIWGIPAAGAVITFLPVLVFAFLFGLSMDYEVFLISRMREEYDRTGSTSGAVIEGTGRTGKLVTSAALILFFAFAALSAAPQTTTKEFASALGIGILLDATVIRALLVPALVAGFGRRAWWLPRRAGRALGIPAPATPAAPPAMAPSPSEPPSP